MLDVNCIYVNYNSATFTIAAISSLLEKTSDTVVYEIIVVDNGSAYEDYELLKTSLEQFNSSAIKIYRSRINTGFGAGNMLGVNFASPSKYYAFINNDTLFTQENTLLDLKLFMDATPDAGVCGPQMMSENGDRISSIDHHATPMRQLLKRDFLEFINSNKYPKRKKEYAKPVACGFIPGSFMFVKTSSFDKVGGFDSALFLYYEESDLCLRILKKLKEKTYHYPAQQYIHYQGKSTEKNVFVKLEQKLSFLYLTQKHHGRFARAFMHCFFTIKYALSSPFNSKKRQMFMALWKGGAIDQSLRCKQIIQEK
ncbi:glycosyltransferase family 2 protein [Nonlabens sp. Ci31]|jgi:GT2 family glycosyltransferase|uniref:glycosyltransferase family 2 protein n=1 Tax=Nonlabens sp. Ci31 TaxID=2608253 RepID=UPI001463272A|nr:glycosyltransferase family 2 protein [Nonlabens sp. Ci31]QJP33148.1 glycosyltransferase family 2 protein [Nonlabens sp. Ci31]